MGLMSWATGGGYRANKQGSRKRLITSNKSQDQHLSRNERKELVGSVRDLRRNFAICAWAIRKHLDHVSCFRFNPKTGSAELDQEFKRQVDEWSKKENFEAGERHSLQSALRIMEASRTVDGDVFGYKLRNGKIQIIEGDKVDTFSEGAPEVKENEFWVNGIRVNEKNNRAITYRTNFRKNNSNGTNNLNFAKDIPAQNMIPLAYYERVDQVRGVSPFLSAISLFQDTDESIEYALQKMKIAQLFGMAFTRDDDQSLGNVSGNTITDSQGNEYENKAGYDVDLGKGIFQLDLDAGDKVDFLENKTPPTETQAFMKMTIDIAIKALDLPYSFFDESHTNFFGSRGAILQYKKSMKAKQADLMCWLDEWVMFKLKHSQAFGINETLNNNLDGLSWSWIPDGVPYWDTAKETRGASAMVAMGLDNPQRIAREVNGSDFYENIKETAKAQQFARDNGVDFILVGVSQGDERAGGNQENQEDSSNTNNNEEEDE